MGVFLNGFADAQVGNLVPGITVAVGGVQGIATHVLTLQFQPGSMRVAVAPAEAGKVARSRVHLIAVDNQFATGQVGVKSVTVQRAGSTDLQSLVGAKLPAQVDSRHRDDAFCRC